MLAAAPATDDAQRAQLRRLRRVEYLQTKSRWWTPVSYTHLTLPTILRV